MPLAVNLSPRQFMNRGLIESIRSILDETGIDPALIEFEITETALMQHGEQTLEILGQINRMGIRLSIDDFGTGYSSLAYLKRFPVKKVKIDRAFIKDLEDSAEDRAIVGAIIALSNSLQLSVVAEGVETEGQYKLLQRQRLPVCAGVPVLAAGARRARLHGAGPRRVAPELAIYSSVAITGAWSDGCVPLARHAVDGAGDAALGQRFRQQDVVDAQPLVLLVAQLPVIPPAERFLRLLEHAERIGQPQLDQRAPAPRAPSVRAQHLAAPCRPGRARRGLPARCCSRPGSPALLAVRAQFLGQPLAQRRQPRQLVDILVGVDRLAIRHVRADEAHALDRRGQDALLRVFEARVVLARRR